MRTIDEVREEISAIFSKIIGEFRIKTYFSYYAIIKDRSMIALYLDGKVFLRIADKDVDFFKSLAETYCLYDKKVGVRTYCFFYVCPSILEDVPLISRLINSTLENLKEIRREQEVRQRKQIRNLPNMNFKIERMLKKIDIHCVNDLIQVGEIQAFVKLVAAGFDCNLELFFKLHGALTHRYIYTFSHQQKIRLMQEINKALYEEGLRKRFSVEW